MTKKKRTPYTGPKCGGATSSGGKCTQPAGWGTEHLGEGKCKLHGGASPRGTESPHFKHGMYSNYLPTSILQKADAMAAQSEMLDLLPELVLTRALLADYMERLKTNESQTKLLPGEFETIRTLTDQIRKLSDSISKQRNDTALTAVEITYLVTRIPEVVVRFIDEPEKQRAFITELFGIAGGVPSRPVELAAGKAPATDDTAG